MNIFRVLFTLAQATLSTRRFRHVTVLLYRIGTLVTAVLPYSPSNG